MPRVAQRQGGLLLARRLSVETRSEEETRALGARLGAAAQPGDVILLLGAFGAGKTTLVQGIARGLGVQAQVSSPSFVIASEYAGRIPLYHVDLYRVKEMDPTTLEALAEYFGGDGLCVVEWPASVPSELAQSATRIELAVAGEETRRLTMGSAPLRLREIFESARSGPARAVPEAKLDGRRRAAGD